MAVVSSGALLYGALSGRVTGMATGSGWGILVVMTLTGGVADVGAIVGSVAAAIALTNAVAAFWRSGPGRRRVWIRNYRKLAPSVRPAYVEQLFGQPTYAYERTSKVENEDRPVPKLVDQSVTVRVWPLGMDGFLMTWSIDDSVVAYSLTTSSSRFHPVIRIGGTFEGNHDDIRLGRTRFSELTRTPDDWQSWIGQYTLGGYVDYYYFKSQGRFQIWSCGFCDAGYRKHMGRSFKGASFDDLRSVSIDPPSARDEFRKSTSINSVLVQGGDFVDLQLQSIGPAPDLVRSPWRPRLWGRWRVWHRQRKLLSVDQADQC